MIDQDILNKLRNGVCAIGYLSVERSKYLQDPTSPYFKVVGTGFLIRDTTIMTNRHVLEAVFDAQAEFGFSDNQRALIFVAPQKGSGLQVIIRVIMKLTAISEPEIDVGFIEFNRGPEKHFRNIKPLCIQGDWQLKVTESIAICGYPYGHAMLQRDKKVYRWGPVVQQGYISAISPFDTSTTPNEILLDIRVAGGMSGAPIFRPFDGKVIGILHSVWEATTALGLPLTTDIIKDWLSRYDHVVR